VCNFGGVFRWPESGCAVAHRAAPEGDAALQEKRVKKACELGPIPVRISNQRDSRLPRMTWRTMHVGRAGCGANSTGRCHGDQVAPRAIVMQHKTQRPVQFEITPATRDALQAWIKQAGLKPKDFLFPSRIHDSPHLGTRQYARILGGWVDELGLDRADYGTHSIRRTTATLIYRRTFELCNCYSATPSSSRP